MNTSSNFKKITKFRFVQIFNQVLIAMLSSLGLFIAVFVIFPNNHWIVSGLLVAIFLYAALSTFYNLYRNSISIHLGSNSMVISKCFGLRKFNFSFDEILGYSTSEISVHYFGKYYRNENVRTFIIHASHNQTFELLEYNYSNFSEIQENLSVFKCLT